MAAASIECGLRQLLPGMEEVLEEVFRGLPAHDVGRLRLVDRHVLKAATEMRPRVLAARGMAGRSWQRCCAAEEALFFDPLGTPADGVRRWTPGPNGKNECNAMEPEDSDVEGESWCWLTGGTDWQGFQGGFRSISETGLRPKWVSFRVRVATPELSGAFLTLAAGQHTWGLSDPVVAFSYRGDERAQNKRCFQVQTGATQKGDVIHACESCEVVPDRPYDVSIQLDWARSSMSVFVNGKRYVHDAHFKSSQGIRFAAMYNWRSGARTAFSDLIIGDVCPVPFGEVASGFEKVKAEGLTSVLSSACPCRRRPLQPSHLGAQPWSLKGAAGRIKNAAEHLLASSVPTKRLALAVVVAAAASQVAQLQW